MDYNKELEKAYDYFDNMVIEIDSKCNYDDNIKELLLFLQKGQFSIDDVINFYNLSDLQDEYDIYRLKKYLFITESNPDNQEGFAEIIAKNDEYYLSIIDDDEYIYHYQ
ncbi:hypothetical protein O0H59_12680 [Staphylococcus pseudintermedius]|nr:hypothetical protein [Staphylococcus pseudintermedius]